MKEWCIPILLLHVYNNDEFGKTGLPKGHTIKHETYEQQRFKQCHILVNFGG